ncbi:zinc finger protein 888-like isoform X2 [Portunus trituberculatus]|uniref:zinc finger protein 888-like isoform X2 n=1 Tax=Portunus trituberculatus TaxID=210409 RepID=UPI001E1D199A|nr:zinc finger protein 888-like isoform X2 [Portunus trituberculatus]
MGKNTSRSSCCLCGKNKKTHPGLKLHAFPENAKRCLEWQRVLKVKLVKRSQAICGDHFDAKWIGTKGQLLSNAVPTPIEYYEDDIIDAPEMRNASLVSKELPFNQKCSTNDEHLVPQATQCHTTGDHENEPEDTEYSSDDDLAFWQKMKKRSKQRLKKSYRKKLFHKYFPDQSSSKNSPVNSQKDQNSLSTKEGNKTSNKVSSVVKGSEDDWITDDEEDDEDDENIDLAFKREWEEKRLPPNTKEKNFVCSICGKAYSKSSFLRTHIVRKHKEHEEAKRYPHFCQHCRKVYLREKDLMKHKQQFRGPCEICGVVLGCSDLFWVHRRDHDSICKVCNKEFTKMSSLYIHMKIEHSENPLSCSVCDKRFHCESVLKRHITNIHDNLTLQKIITKCDKCDFSAKTQRALRIHQGLVHRLKPNLFTCKKCKKTFSTRVTYKNHVATHRKRSIICPLCSNKFTSEDELQTHTVSVHEVSDSVGRGKETLSSHLDSSHLSQYACGFCNITLVSNEDISQHMHKYHDMDIDSPREIRLQIERVRLSEIDKNAKGVRIVGSEETYPQELDKPTHFGSSSDKLSLLVPPSAMPLNVNVVEVNGVQYHVVRKEQQH